MVPPPRILELYAVVITPKESEEEELEWIDTLRYKTANHEDSKKLKKAMKVHFNQIADCLYQKDLIWPSLTNKDGPDKESPLGSYPVSLEPELETHPTSADDQNSEDPAPVVSVGVDIKKLIGLLQKYEALNEKEVESNEKTTETEEKVTTEETSSELNEANQ